MAAFEDKVQALVDEVYREWQKEENKNKSKWDILDEFSAAHQIAVVLGNFNYQVENGGLEQWIYNGYFRDDAEKLIEYLEAGAEFDERCRTILDKIYKLDQYARETDCDRYGNYSDPDDEDGDRNFIGDMINCGAFDTWYYEHCGKDDWWKVVSGIIDKTEGRESAPVRRDEQGGGNAALSHPLRVYIENVHDDRIGGFTMPLPTTPGEAGKQLLKLNDVDIAATIMKLHAVCGDGNMFQAAGNLKMLFNGHDRDYLLLAGRDNVCLSPAIEAYKRGTETSAFISSTMKSSEERPDFIAFAVRVHNRGEDGITGDLVELNGKALCANTSRHAVAPDRIDAVFLGGATKSYDLWSWAELPQYARDDIKDYKSHFPNSGLAEAAKRCASFMGANEAAGETVGTDTFLQKANAAFMSAAQNPQPDMIRVANEAAKEILARGDADVYRLAPEGAVKLAPIEAARAMCFAEHRELAVKREDFAGLDNWSKRAANKLLRRNERGERDKIKHKGEEL
ncbi:MAG: hypothetical protein LBL37_08550 [Gracilibacteraceae bacterium]|jgi:hypothetical protein|nr:hypothetical protein [Gracilibacteraceae bacterium]